MIIFYGLTAQIPQLAGMSPLEIGQKLREIGGDGVFLKELRADWVDALQSAGLHVYASQTIFVDNADLWQRFPDSLPITADGPPSPQEEWYRPLRPTHGKIRELRLAQLTQLTADLPLDGVWLDFIRWPARWEKSELRLYDSSFDAETLAQFSAERDIDLPNRDPREAARRLLHHHREEWLDWRCGVIESFVAEAVRRIRYHRPAAQIGLFTIPWIGDDLRRVVGQDLGQLGRHVNALSPMVYHRLCGQSIGWVGQVSGWAKAHTDAAIWPVIETLPPPDSYPAAEFAEVLRRARQGGSGDLILFKLDGLLADTAKQSLLHP
ncbi:MAG: hypothetical protein KF893_16975 [Caldilineaceae bacterium]|nr:hypothetical protein [Caldilineaceae bacterium]